MAADEALGELLDLLRMAEGNLTEVPGSRKSGEFELGIVLGARDAGIGDGALKAQLREQEGELGGLRSTLSALGSRAAGCMQAAADRTLLERCWSRLRCFRRLGGALPAPVGRPALVLLWCADPRPRSGRHRRALFDAARAQAASPPLVPVVTATSAGVRRSSLHASVAVSCAPAVRRQAAALRTAAAALPLPQTPLQPSVVAWSASAEQKPLTVSVAASSTPSPRRQELHPATASSAQPLPQKAALVASVDTSSSQEVRPRAATLRTAAAGRPLPQTPLTASVAASWSPLAAGREPAERPRAGTLRTEAAGQPLPRTPLQAEVSTAFSPSPATRPAELHAVVSAASSPAPDAQPCARPVLAASTAASSSPAPAPALAAAERPRAATLRTAAAGHPLPLTPLRASVCTSFAAAAERPASLSAEPTPQQPTRLPLHAVVTATQTPQPAAAGVHLTATEVNTAAPSPLKPADLQRALRALHACADRLQSVDAEDDAADEASRAAEDALLRCAASLDSVCGRELQPRDDQLEAAVASIAAMRTDTERTLATCLGGLDGMYRTALRHGDACDVAAAGSLAQCLGALDSVCSRVDEMSSSVAAPEWPRERSDGGTALRTVLKVLSRARDVLQCTPPADGLSTRARFAVAAALQRQRERDSAAVCFAVLRANRTAAKQRRSDADSMRAQRAAFAAALQQQRRREAAAVCFGVLRGSGATRRRRSDSERVRAGAVAAALQQQRRREKAAVCFAALRANRTTAQQRSDAANARAVLPRLRLAAASALQRQRDREAAAVCFAVLRANRTASKRRRSDAEGARAVLPRVQLAAASALQRQRDREAAAVCFAVLRANRTASKRRRSDAEGARAGLTAALRSLRRSAAESATNAPDAEAWMAVLRSLRSAHRALLARSSGGDDDSSGQLDALVAASSSLARACDLVLSDTGADTQEVHGALVAADSSLQRAEEVVRRCDSLPGSPRAGVEARAGDCSPPGSPASAVDRGQLLCMLRLRGSDGAEPAQPAGSTCSSPRGDVDRGQLLSMLRSLDGAHGRMLGDSCETDDSPRSSPRGDVDRGQLLSMLRRLDGARDRMLQSDRSDSSSPRGDVDRGQLLSMLRRLDGARDRMLQSDRSDSSSPRGDVRPAAGDAKKPRRCARQDARRRR
eukprot:TRINITY_DN3298_c0_g1_i9.p1 TRINITY_DN3298_c0_g1~~TRINITY_DN3298_c0_g1_i9.p1  ORF type:complete len:1173 (+),score=296.76 TRINITY_DN3298_c0_g1_i9:54-3521(+)